MVGAGPLRMLPLPVTARMKCVSSVSLVCSASLMELTSLERPPELFRRALDGVQLPMRISSARLGAGDADGRVELTLGFLWRNREKEGSINVNVGSVSSFLPESGAAWSVSQSQTGFSANDDNGNRGREKVPLHCIVLH